MSDFIKREDAMELINKCVSHTSPKAEAIDFDFRHGEINGLNWASDIIEAMPSADVAPVRHGRWEDVDRMQMHDLHGVLTWGNSFKCTECQFKTFAVEGHITQYHYCPNCGARMDGDENE